MPAADDTVRHDNERRVARMRVWINLAETLPAGEDHAHVRFVMYWIAYEAAYQVYKVGGDSSDKPDRASVSRATPTAASQSTSCGRPPPTAEIMLSEEDSLTPQRHDALPARRKAPSWRKTIVWLHEHP